MDSAPAAEIEKYDNPVAAERIRALMAELKTNTVSVFDFDGTVIDGNLLAETVFNLVKHRLPKEAPARIKIEQALSVAPREIDGRVSIYSDPCRKLAIPLVESGIFCGMNANEIRELQHICMQDIVASCFSWPLALILALRRCKPRGLILCITGTPQYIADMVCPILGFDAAIGVTYANDGDVFVEGKPELSPGMHKNRVMRWLAEYCELNLQNAIAVGDSKFDIGMFDSATYPIAINPKLDLIPHVRESGRTEKPIAWVDQKLGEGAEEIRCWLPKHNKSLRQAVLKDFLPDNVCQAIGEVILEMRRSWRYR